MSKTQNRKTARPIAAMMFRLPFMINCEEFEAFIVDYLEENLSRSQRIKFDMHLKLCRECRDYLQSYKATMNLTNCLLYTSPSPRDKRQSRMPSSA